LTDSALNFAALIIFLLLPAPQATRLRLPPEKTNMLKTLNRFIRNESGATALEYAFIAAVISVVLVGAAGNIGNTLTNTFSDVDGNL